MYIFFKKVIIGENGIFGSLGLGRGVRCADHLEGLGGRERVASEQYVGVVTFAYFEIGSLADLSLSLSLSLCADPQAFVRPLAFPLKVQSIR